MKSYWAALLLAVVLSGCASPAQQDDTSPPTAAGPATQSAEIDEVAATVRGDDITMRQLEAPLIEAYGLNMLLELVQVDLAQQDARRQNITVTDQDIEDETVRTLISFRTASKQELDQQGATTEPSDNSLTPLERDRLMGGLLSSQHLTEVEFGLAMKTNATLRKLVEPGAMAAMTEQHVRDHFNAIYGEKARVRFIRLADMLTVAKVEADLKGGRTFDAEEKLYSYDTLGRPASGELQPFSRQDPYYPAEFKMVAFGLNPGQISDPVQIKDQIYLLQLVELIPPQHANFEDYKDAVKKDLYEQEVQARLKVYLQNIRVIARQTLEIHNPVLLRQWNQNLRNADELRDELHKQQQADTTQPATEPDSQPSNVPGY